MRDAKLKSGRAAWRIYAAKFGQFAPAPTDICARLDAWRQAGYPAASRPAIKDPVFEEALGNNRYDRLDAKLERSGERLRKLACPSALSAGGAVTHSSTRSIRRTT